MVADRGWRAGPRALPNCPVRLSSGLRPARAVVLNIHFKYVPNMPSLSMAS